MPLSLAPLREVVDQRSKARWILSGGAEGKVAVIVKKRQGAFARYK